MVNKYSYPDKTSLTEAENGFTLIEMMFSISMGLIILAGLTTMFVSMSNVSRSVASRGERMGDLYLASQIMQAELRESKAVCWDSVKNRIIYQPLDSTDILDVAACNTLAAGNGSFELRPAKASTIHNTPYICWDRPLKNRCEELIRELTPSGLVATSSAGTWTITLTGQYRNEEKKDRQLSIRFKTWPRNKI